MANEPKAAGYNPEEIYALTGIELSKENSTVVVKTITVEAIEISGNTVKYVGRNKAGEPVFVPGNRRTLKWFYYSRNGKKCLNYKHIHETMPQGYTPLAFAVQVHFICESKTGIAFSHTGLKLVPLNAAIFEAFMAGQYKPTPFTEIPFNLGETTVKTEFGNITVNFGVYNGNKGISAVNPEGYKVIPNTKHLGHNITQFASNLRTFITQEEVIHAKENGKWKKAGAKWFLEGGNPPPS